MMSKTIKARFKNGVIEPLEEVELKEGEEFILTIMRTPEVRYGENAFKESRGGWKELIDCEELKRNIYGDRLVYTRAEVKL